LSVSYELYDEDLILAKTSRQMDKGNLSALLPPPQYERQAKHAVTQRKLRKITETRDLTLKELNFLDARINKIEVKKFIMRNKSGIKTSFTISAANYQPSRFLDEDHMQVSVSESAQKPRLSSKYSSLEISEQSNSKVKNIGLHSKSARVIKFALSTKNKSNVIKKKKVYALKHPLLTEAREQEKKFTSALGETYTATKRLEHERSYYLENNKGVAIVCQPHKGELAPHSEIIITVTLYNNICGKYEDTITSEVKGVPAVEIPVSINIKGSPIVIPSNQVGVYFNEYPPALIMKPTVLNGGKVTKTFKIENTGIQNVTIDWKIFDMKDIIGNTESDLFTLSFGKNEGNAIDPYRVELEAIEPKEESKDSPFTIIPKQIVIPPRGKASFEVTFDASKSLGVYNSVLLVHPKVVGEENSNLGAVYLTLRGQTVASHLTIDKKCRMDGKSYVQLDIWPTNEFNAPSSTKKIGFINESPADIAVNLNMTGPFQLASTLTNAPPHALAKANTKVQTLFNLLPGTFLETVCKFMRPDPNDHDKWPLVERAIHSGTLQLNYANATTEEITIEAHLLRPHVTIHVKASTKDDWAEDEFDFGTVYIDRERYKDITMCLKNETKVTAKWTLNHVKIIPKEFSGYKTVTKLERENSKKVDDQSVFAFSTTEVLSFFITIGNIERTFYRHNLVATRRVSNVHTEG